MSNPPSRKGSASSARGSSSSAKGSSTSAKGSGTSAKGSGTSATGSARSATGSARSVQGSAHSQGSSRLRAPTSRVVEPKSSMSKMQTTNIEKTCSGTKVTTQSRISATTITKLPAKSTCPASKPAGICRPSAASRPSAICGPPPASRPSGICRPPPANRPSAICGPPPASRPSGICGPPPANRPSSICGPPAARRSSNICGPPAASRPSNTCRPPSICGPPGAARIRLASATTKEPGANVQTTRVKVMGAGLRPTGKAKQKCPAVCAKKPSSPILEPFTEEVEQGRPVPAGMYYMPLQGAAEQGLGPEERKLRQKLQKYTPTSLSHWKVPPLNDPFAKAPGPLRQVQPDVVSGMFRVGGPSQQQPVSRNPQLEQRLDPSQPPEHWSLSLREAMSLESGVYEQENPEDGQKESFLVETAHIERQVDSKLPGTPPCGPSQSDEPPCALALPGASSPPSPQDIQTPLLPTSRPCPDLENLQHPEFDHEINVTEVSAPRMQSPVGEIDAQTTVYMQRRIQASHMGTTVDTAVRGTHLVAPGQAKQIDILKQDRLPPPRPHSPPLQYVMPPRDERQGPPALYPVPGGRPYDDSMMGQPGSPRGPSAMYPSPEGRPYDDSMMAQPVSPRGPPALYSVPGGRPYDDSMMGQPGSPRGPSAMYPAPERRPYDDSMMAQPGSPRWPPALYPVPGGRPYDDSMMGQPGSPQVYQSPSSPYTEYQQSQSMMTQRGYSPQQVPPPQSPVGPGPVQIPMSPSTTPPPPPSPINLEAAADVPCNSDDASIDVLRRLVDEERQDVIASQELPPDLTRKLNKLKKKPLSMRILEETLDQSVPIDEESDNLKSDILAELMHSQETGVINPSSSPRKTYDQLFPPLDDEQSITVSPAAPAPLNDVVVPVGEPDVNAVAVVNEEIAEVAAEANENNEEIPAGNAYAAVAEGEKQLSEPSPPREHKPREKKESEEDDAEYIPSGELDEQKAPWDINLGSLEDLVGGKMSMLSAWDNLPSNESVRATAGRLEYVLDVQKPQHHSCVQLRGSQLPAWFPGYYSVLPHVDGCVRLERSPSRAFASAWHVFAPYQSTEQSEVVYL